MQHLVGNGIQQLPVEALGQESLRGRGGTARFHRDLVHCGADDGRGHYLAFVAGGVLQKDADLLFPGGGEVVFFGEADGHPVRVPQRSDELHRRGHVARGELGPHGLGGGGGGILHDQQAGHHPVPGDHLHQMPAQARSALVRPHEGTLGGAEGAGGRHALPVFSVDHGGEAVVHPQHQQPQGQQDAQEDQQNGQAPVPRGDLFRHVRLGFNSFHACIIALLAPHDHFTGNSSQK